MHLANLTALWWGLLALPIVVFYILKIRLRRESVSTTMFWRQIFEEKRPRSIWQRLRHLLSLLVQLALLALLIAALAKPYFDWEVQQARHIVLVVDNSASMRANDVEPNRWTAASNAAAQYIKGLRARDRMTIISAGGHPHVHCALTSHQRTLRNLLEGIAPSDAPTHVPQAVELARRVIEDAKNRRIVVLTDGCFQGAEELLAGDDIEPVLVGDSTGNVGITQFQVRRSLTDTVGYETLVEVTNCSEESVTCRLEMQLGADLIDVIPLELAAGETWKQVILKTSTTGGHLVARLDRDDALAADNEAYAILPGRDLQPVLLVTEGNLFLEKVFEAMPLVQLSVVREMPPRVAGGALVVYDREIPSQLPAGNVFVVNPSTSCDLWELGDAVQNPIVTDLDEDSPLLTNVRLDNVLMPEARAIDFQREAKELVSGVEGDVLYAVLARPEGEVLVLTVNLSKGDLPLRTAFPIMVSNALNWVAGRQGELRQALATGQTTQIQLDRLGSSRVVAGEDVSATPRVLRAPDGTRHALPDGVSEVTIGPLVERGIWQVVATDAGDAPRESSPENSRRDETARDAMAASEPYEEIACNLASAAESDLRPRLDLSAEAVGEQAATAAWQPMWFYLIALAWALAGLEWFLYQRRWIS